MRSVTRPAISDPARQLASISLPRDEENSFCLINVSLLLFGSVEDNSVSLMIWFIPAEFSLPSNTKRRSLHWHPLLPTFASSFQKEEKTNVMPAAHDGFVILLEFIGNGNRAYHCSAWGISPMRGSSGLSCRARRICCFFRIATTCLSRHTMLKTLSRSAASVTTWRSIIVSKPLFWTSAVNLPAGLNL